MVGRAEILRPSVEHSLTLDLDFLGPVYEPRWGLPSHVAAYDWLP